MLKKFVIEIASKFVISPKRAQIGLIKYSTNAKLAFGLNSYTNFKDLSTAVQALKFIGGWTYTGKALTLARNQVKKEFPVCLCRIGSVHVTSC